MHLKCLFWPTPEQACERSLALRACNVLLNKAEAEIKSGLRKTSNLLSLVAGDYFEEGSSSQQAH